MRGQSCPGSFLRLFVIFRSQKPSATRGAPALPVCHRLGGGGNLSRGFTLVELLVGATLSAAVMAAVFSSYIYLGRGLARLANQQILETEARRTLGYFTQDGQTATALTDTTNLGAGRMSLTVPVASGNATITYYYNSNSSATSVTINGTSISMEATALTRCVYNGSTVTSQTLLRNITGLTLSYYDSSGNEYTNYTDYLPGIKQLSLEFSTQLGNSGNGTQTLVYQVTSNRVILRNRGFLQ
jgi:prepilin-type N-terminal cleavage/methylation domain-containing protein